MKTFKEIVEWVDEETQNSLESLRAEPNHNSNHLATAYSAEYDLLIRLKEWLFESDASQAQSLSGEK